MLGRRWRATFLLCMCVMLSSACELTVRVGTQLESDGSGELSLSMHLDDELVDALEQTAGVEGGADVSSIMALFDGLRAQGWITSESRPSGGLFLQARRSFADADGFEAILTELSGLSDPAEQPVDLGGLELDHLVERSFLRTSSRFSGSIDLSFGEDADPLIQELQAVLADAVRFEIAATLPGQVTTIEGGGTFEDGTVVWRPVIGSRSAFLAEARQLRVGSLLVILVPSLVVLAVATWALVGRRRRHEGEADLDGEAGDLVVDLDAETPTNGTASKQTADTPARDER